MMKYLGIISLIVLFAFPPLFAQAPDTAWTGVYGGFSEEKVRDIKQTTDGGYIITGETFSIGAGDGDIYLLKIDSIGNFEWEKAYGGTLEDRGECVQQTSDGGYIISGWTKSFGPSYTNGYLIKTDSLGDTTWTRVLTPDQAYYVIESSENCYIVTGFDIIGGTNNFAYLLAYDVNGDSLWMRLYNDITYGSGRCLTQTIDKNGYIITGHQAFWPANVILIKTDLKGDKIWNQAYSWYLENTGEDVQQTSDGGYIIGGYTKSGVDPDRIYLIKTDSLGNLEWEKTYEGNPNARAYSAKQTSDGGYIIGGWTGYNHPGWHVDSYLIRTDSNGDTLWTEKYGENVYGQNYGRSLQITNDNGYIIAGDSPIGAASRRVWVIKTEPEQIGVEDEQDLRSKIIDLRLLCYPNPFTSMARIKLIGLNGNQQTNLDIYDASGRKVREFILSPSSIILETTWNGRDEVGKVAPPGIYFLKLNGKNVGKVVKVR